MINNKDQRQQKKEFEDVKSEIKVIKRFISNPADLIPQNINTPISNKEKKL